MNYLASPPLGVAYALAGTIDIDLDKDSLGTGSDGQPVYLKDIWPSSKEISDTIIAAIGPDMFKKNYADVLRAIRAGTRSPRPMARPLRGTMPPPTSRIRPTSKIGRASCRERVCQYV